MGVRREKPFTFPCESSPLGEGGLGVVHLDFSPRWRRLDRGPKRHLRFGLLLGLVLCVPSRSVVQDELSSLLVSPGSEMTPPLVSIGIPCRLRDCSPLRNLPAGCLSFFEQHLFDLLRGREVVSCTAPPEVRISPS